MTYVTRRFEFPIFVSCSNFSLPTHITYISGKGKSSNVSKGHSNSVLRSKMAHNMSRSRTPTRRKVLVIGTGGTIASEPTDDGFSPVSLSQVSLCLSTHSTPFSHISQKLTSSSAMTPFSDVFDNTHSSPTHSLHPTQHSPNLSKRFNWVLILDIPH